MVLKKIILFIVICAIALTIPVYGAYYGTITSNDVNFRSGPSDNSTVYYSLSNGKSVIVRGTCGDGNKWYEIECDGKIGYVYADYVSFNSNSEKVIYTEENEPILAEPAKSTQSPVFTPTPAISPTPGPAVSPTPTPTPETTNNSNANDILTNAQKYVGTPYQWAGSSPDDGFDCSGFVQYVFAESGYTIKRVAQEQADTAGVEVNEMAPGDILCFGSSQYNIWHVGIYLGDNQFIHSSPMGGVIISELSKYDLRLIKIKRVAGV